MASDFKQFVINVLGYRDEDGWVALAIEMDLRGHGASFESALDDLKELAEMQISFAMEQGLPSMIWHPAEDVWIEKWQHARRKWFSDLVSSKGQLGNEDDYRAGSIIPDVPPAYIVAGRSEYSRVST